MRLIVPSFAKINWSLEILGRREDGYHEVRTLYQSIDLRDEITLHSHADSEIDLEISGRPVAEGKENLVYQAAHLLQKAANKKLGAKIFLRKRIPVGGGLGGGSSNAAMTLLALNELWQCRLSRDRLLELAAFLGSDVPFFLVGGTALGTGRGERVLPLPEIVQTQDIVLLYPNLEISTKEAYSLGDWEICGQEGVLTGENMDTTMHRLHGVLDQELEQGEREPSLSNDFERLLLRQYPALVEGREYLKRIGCRQVTLSGSGSVLFGLGEVEKIKKRVENHQKKGEVFFCRTLSRRDYKNFLTHAGIDL